MKFMTQIITSLVLLTTLASCGGQKPMVTDFTVTPSYDQSDFHLDIAASLSLGNVTLPSITIPIVIRNGQEVGSVSMVSVGNGGNYLSIELNVSAITHLDAIYARLPNGSLLPLIANNKTIKIPIDKKLVLYVTFSSEQMAIGLAVPFKTLDGLGRKVGTTSLFPMFNIKGVVGAAGLYTSKNAGKNGFALFADVTNVIPSNVLRDLESTSSRVRLDYSSKVPSSSNEKKINKEVYKLHKARKKLSIR